MTSFANLVDLAAERLGGKALEASDEFFAPKENLLKPGRGVFLEEKFTDRGKWMDGWETRRRRGPGHDWCVVRLGLAGILRGVDVDTNHFRGNHPESCTLDGAADGREWTQLVGPTPLEGHAQNLIPIRDCRTWTHVRLNIFPDGGVARLRVYGEVVPDRTAWGEIVDLAALENGGRVVAANDMFFGSRHNLILSGPSTHMGDGWETRRRRTPGNDWVVIRLGAPGILRRAVVDTSHFKGNYPESCSLEGCRSAEEVPGADGEWKPLLDRTPLTADAEHVFEGEGLNPGVVSHVRLRIYPDGGVARLRLFAEPLLDEA